MEMVDWVSKTPYLLSQNLPKDSNALLCIDVKMCALRTTCGKLGISSSRPVCDAVIMVPSGCFTWIPFLHGITFVQGDEVQM